MAGFLPARGSVDWRYLDDRIEKVTDEIEGLARTPELWTVDDCSGQRLDHCQCHGRCGRQWNCLRGDFAA